MPCTPLGTEKVLHGHLPAADARTGAVLIRCDPSQAMQRDDRTADIVAAAGVLAMPTITLARPALASRTEALVAGAVALQLLTLELSMARGTNPDLVRREQPLYRRVAELGRAADPTRTAGVRWVTHHQVELTPIGTRPPGDRAADRPGSIENAE